MTHPTPPYIDDWTHRLPNRLGGRSIDELDADFHTVTAASRGTHGQPRWTVGAYVDDGTYEEINTYARTEITSGAEALLFRLYRQPDSKAISQILRGVDATAIGLNCSLRYPGQDPAELFRDLVQYLRAKGYDLRRVSGSVDFDPLLDWSDPPFPPLIRLLKFVCRWMPSFAVLQVNAAGFNHGVHLADTELALALAKGVEYLKEIEAHGYSPGSACPHLKFALTVGTSFYGDVAKLRALRRLWPRALRTIGIEAKHPIRIAAHSDVNVLSNDWARNRAALNAQIVAAALGQASEIYLAPLEDIDDAPTAQARQYALHTQRDLRHQFPSPAPEAELTTITDALVEATWENYQHLVAQGGFASAIEF